MDPQCQNIAMTLSSGKTRAIGNMHVFVSYQINVVNKQLVSTLTWNNPVAETSTGESYKLMIYGHLYAKGKHLNVEGVGSI